MISGLLVSVPRGRRIPGVALLSVALLAAALHPAIAQDSDQPACSNVGSTTGEGAVIGGAAGVAAGGLAGRSFGSALIGGALGALGGAVVGNVVGKNNCSHANTDASLNEQIANADEQTQEYQRDAALYNARAADAQRKASVLQAEYNQGSLSAQSYRDQMARYREDQAALGRRLTELEASREKLEREAQEAGPNGGQLAEEARQEADTQQQLQNDYDAISNSLAAVPSA